MPPPLLDLDASSHPTYVVPRHNTCVRWALSGYGWSASLSTQRATMESADRTAAKLPVPECAARFSPYWLLGSKQYGNVNNNGGLCETTQQLFDRKVRKNCCIVYYHTHHESIHHMKTPTTSLRNPSIVLSMHWTKIMEHSSCHTSYAIPSFVCYALLTTHRLDRSLM